MYDIGEDKSKPPTHPQIERLSYELTNGDKRLRYFAVTHSPQPGDPNYQQYDILEKKFQESPPDLVLIEGNIDFDYKIQTREEAIKRGEQYFTSYLAQKYNVSIESGDIANNQTVPNETRDKYVIENAASKFKTHKNIDIVFGSGHAIREKAAWEQYFEL